MISCSGQHISQCLSDTVSCREIGGTLRMVPLKINPIYTLYIVGIDGIYPLLKVSLKGLNSQGHHQFPYNNMGRYIFNFPSICQVSKLRRRYNNFVYAWLSTWKCPLVKWQWFLLRRLWMKVLIVLPFEQGFFVIEISSISWNVPRFW